MWLCIGIIASQSGTHWVYTAIRLLLGHDELGEIPMKLAEMLPPTKPAAPAVTRWNPTGEDSFEALLGREPAGARVIVTHAPVEWLPKTGGKVVYPWLFTFAGTRGARISRRPSTTACWSGWTWPSSKPTWAPAG